MLSTSTRLTAIKAKPAQTDARNAGGFEYLKAGFITHMHADHIADSAAAHADGFNDGVRVTAIIGPGRNETGAREPKNKAPALVNPVNPYLGTVDMVNGLIDSFAHNFNDALSDVGIPSPNSSTNHAISPKAAKANGQNVAPLMRPFEVYKDDARVTAIGQSRSDISFFAAVRHIRTNRFSVTQTETKTDKACAGQIFWSTRSLMAVG